MTASPTHSRRPALGTPTSVTVRLPPGCYPSLKLRTGELRESHRAAMPSRSDRSATLSSCSWSGVISIHGCHVSSSSSRSQWPVMVFPSSLKLPVKRSLGLLMRQTRRPSSSARLAS